MEIIDNTSIQGNKIPFNSVLSIIFAPSPQRLQESIFLFGKRKKENLMQKVKVDKKIKRCLEAV